MPVSRQALKKQIAAGDTGPLYILIGDDDSEKSAVATEFAEMVDEGLRAFSVDRLFGGEIRADDLFDAAATLPMMAPRRIVIVFDAERLLIPKREGKAADAEQERLEAFVKNPPAHATIVFVCGPLDQRRRLVKLLLKEAQVVDCGTIADAADAERWVKARAERDKIPLDTAAVRTLVERAGIDIVRLRSGLERVALYALGQSRISADDVRQVVAATAEATNFGIANAIEQNDAAAALRELTLALDGGAQPFFLMGQLRWVAEKMPRARLKDAIDAVFRTDEAIKSSGGDPKVLLERLVVELCSTASSRMASRTSRPR
ncbi:MAG TPA: DNA polymerase III subunit delta [Vicinamibacterales bacterium]|jgi:DNA polymerase III subunit delta|nr:DNA polymerase III subunit delta [Vicinamibacterales bacterium]